MALHLQFSAISMLITTVVHIAYDDTRHMLCEQISTNASQVHANTARAQTRSMGTRALASQDGPERHAEKVSSF